MSAGLLHRFGRAVVDCDTELGELPPASGDAEVVLRRGEVVEPPQWDRAWQVDGETDRRLARVGDDYVLELGAGLRARIDAGAGEVCYEASLPAEIEARLLVHQVLPMVFAHRGALLVHGSAVLVDGAAVALVGRSGAGKSTLAAALAGDGEHLLADDAVWISGAADGFVCCGTYPGLWLSRRASDAVGLPSSQRDHRDKAHLLADLEPAVDAALTDVVCIVESGDDERDLLSIEPLPAAQLYFGLFDHAFQLDPSHRTRAAELFAQLTAVAAGVRGWQAKLPDDHDRLPEICDRVRQVIGAARRGGR